MVVAAVPESTVRELVVPFNASTVELKLTAPSVPPLSVVIVILDCSSTAPVKVKLGAASPAPDSAEVVVMSMSS